MSYSSHSSGRILKQERKTNISAAELDIALTVLGYMVFVLIFKISFTEFIRLKICFFKCRYMSSDIW